MKRAVRGKKQSFMAKQYQLYIYIYICFIDEKKNKKTQLHIIYVSASKKYVHVHASKLKKKKEYVQPMFFFHYVEYSLNNWEYYERNFDNY